jgi:site-specific DNA-methyltransferase (adenine-specific)
MIESSKRKASHPLQSMCSYLGSFPPYVPRSLIARWIPTDALVLDPFCGAGTTLVEAVLTGRSAIGSDMNPLAVAISSAKVQAVTIDEVMYRVGSIARDFEPIFDLTEVPDQVHLIFHERTIQQLCFLKEELTDSPEDIFLRGAVLGIMHGKIRRDGSSAYLSIDMPNTFSMSPEYVRNYVKKHGLAYRPVDVFSKLRERAKWLLRDGALASAERAKVFKGDATQINHLLSSEDREIGGIVTSPPYLGVLRYGAFNWIRLWFLSDTPFAVDSRLDTTDSLDKYLSFMATFLLGASEVLPTGAPVVLVIGDVVEKGQHLDLAGRVWEELEGVIPYTLECIAEDNFDVNDKTTRIWGSERKGRATPTDRVLVLRRS